MISLNILQLFELLIGTVAFLLFVALFLLTLWSKQNDPGSGGCSLLILFPLLLIGFCLILYAFSGAL
jgi:hypothetical protein